MRMEIKKVEGIKMIHFYLKSGWGIMFAWGMVRD